MIQVEPEWLLPDSRSGTSPQNFALWFGFCQLFFVNIRDLKRKRACALLKGAICEVELRHLRMLPASAGCKHCVAEPEQQAKGPALRASAGAGSYCGSTGAGPARL